MSLINEDKVRLITGDLIEARNQDLLKKLPLALKPVMEEVAENVAGRTEAKMSDLLNVDINEPESKRALRDDLSHLRRQRTRRESLLTKLLITLFAVPFGAMLTWFFTYYSP